MTGLVIEPAVRVSGYHHHGGNAGDQEAQILRLESDLSIERALHARELDLQLAVTIWLLADEPETLIVDIDRSSQVVHSLIETSQLGALETAIRSVVAGTMPRHLCVSCRWVTCGQDGVYCAGALKNGEVPALRVPRKVRSAIEKLAAVKALSGEARDV